MPKKLLFLSFVLLLLVACGGEFDDEGYPIDDFAYEDDEAYPADDMDEYMENDDMMDEPESNSSTGVATAGSGDFAETDCPFDVANRYNVSCGILTVPENRTTNNGQTIEIAIAILPAGSNSAEPDPVIYLEGGPGGSALSSLEAEPDAWAEYGFARNRDIIFIDQRGTGYSSPSLNCPEMDDDYEGIDNELDCLDRLLDEGVDVTAYNSVENAADVNALAEALGLDSYNLVGISYGTRLGLAVMRDHPQRVRSVVLDSPFPPNADPATNEAALTYDRILAVIDLCEQDLECSGAYPDLEQVLIDTVEWMNTEPPSDDLDGDTLLQVLYQALFSADEYASAVPLLIYLSYEEDYSFLEEIADELLGGGYSRPFQSYENDGDSEGMYTSVMCHDEFVFSSLDQMEDATADAVPTELRTALSAATAEFFELCNEWGAGTADPFVNAAVVSDIPTLVMVGELDPATPPVWGQLTVDTLSNGQLHIFGGGGHSLLSTNQCAMQLASDFIDNPTGSLDSSCVQQQPAIQFEY